MGGRLLFIRFEKINKMTFPTLPLDNTSKFVFYFGLLLILFSSYKLQEHVQSARKGNLDFKKQQLVDSIDNKLFKRGLHNLPLDSLRARLIRNQLSVLDIKAEQEQVNQYIILSVIGVFLSFISKSKVESREKLETQILELDLKIKELEFSKKKSERAALRKYIRIK